MTDKRTFADEIGMQVEYLGENVNRQFCFGNGTQLVTDIYPSFAPAVARFGNRINTHDNEYQYSGPFMAGRSDGLHSRPYEPIRQGGKQAVLEYGAGYIRGLLDFEKNKKAVASVPAVVKGAAVPEPVKPAEPVVPVAQEPIKRKPGRPKKNKSL